MALKRLFGVPLIIRYSVLPRENRGLVRSVFYKSFSISIFNGYRHRKYPYLDYLVGLLLTFQKIMAVSVAGNVLYILINKCECAHMCIFPTYTFLSTSHTYDISRSLLDHAQYSTLFCLSVFRSSLFWRELIIATTIRYGFCTIIP